MNNKLKSLLCKLAYSPVGDKLVSASGMKRLSTEIRVRSAKKKQLSEAEKEFSKPTAKGDLRDYKAAQKKHWVSYSEYANQYEFYKKTEEERDEYVSRLKMAYFYWRYAPGSAKAVFRDKPVMLRTFKDYVHRPWMFVPKSSFEDFRRMVTLYDCIAKPCDGKLGKGIYKIYKDSDHKDDRSLYESCVKNRILLEACIDSCEELKAFHPQSLNTVRVVTVSNREKACVLSGVLRTGVGDSVVDNSHAGGISAQINVKTGIVETDGANTGGERFVSHPDSGIVFKGFQIPRWDLLVTACCDAARQTDNPITGWDVVLDKNGDVEFIEANYGPDMDMMQTRYKKGAKKRIYALIKEYCGIEMR